MAIKKSELYSTLWKCCDELRGGMDARINKSPMAKGMSFEKEDKKWEITGYTDCAYTSPNIGMSCVAHTTDSNTINTTYRIFNLSLIFIFNLPLRGLSTSNS